MSNLGKIVLDNNYANPRVIIANVRNVPRAVELVKSDDKEGHLKLSQEDFTKISYRGKKLDDRSMDLSRITAISNLQLREIGCLSEDAYCKLLKEFVNYHTMSGAKSLGYLEVRDEVQEQLIKRMK